MTNKSKTATLLAILVILLIAGVALIIIFPIKNQADNLCTWNQTQKINIQTATIRGDANLDGRVSVGDILYIENAMLAYIPEVESMDVDNDGRIGIGDIMLIECIMFDLL
jgi:hypothetical protein